MKKAIKKAVDKFRHISFFNKKDRVIEFNNIKELEAWAKKQEGYKFYDLVPEHRVGVFTVVDKNKIKIAHVPMRELIIAKPLEQPTEMGVTNHQQNIAGFVHVGNIMEKFHKLVLCCIPQMRHNIEAGNNIIRISMANGQSVASLAKEEKGLSPIVLQGDISAGFNSIEHEIDERVEINLLDFFKAYQKKDVFEKDMMELLKTARDQLVTKVIHSERVFAHKLNPCVFFEIKWQVIPFIRDGKAGLVSYSLFYVIGGYIPNSSSEDKQ